MNGTPRVPRRLVQWDATTGVVTYQQAMNSTVERVRRRRLAAGVRLGGSLGRNGHFA